MNHQVDVHPEDLLDRERDGTLTVDERHRLEDHSSQCAPCALERRATADFTSERMSVPSDELLLQRLQSGALGIATIAPSVATTHTAARSRRKRRSPWAVAAIVMFAATGATASFWSVRRVMVQRSHASAFLTAPPPPPVAAGQPTRVKESLHLAPAITLPLEVPPTDVPPIEAPRESPPVAVAPRVHAPEEAPPPASADQVFASANDARRRGDSAQALKLYRQLQQQYPGTREERTSRVLLGRLLLDRGEDPAQALGYFSGYLDESPNGTLAEEARLGRALALMRLGRTTEERQAWQQLLAAHPHSIHAERARKRLDDLR